jgi:hypothetical protein
MARAVRPLHADSRPPERTTRRLFQTTMNPDEFESAHRIVADYAALLEQDVDHPAPLRSLPYPKQTIKAAILTCAAALRQTEQLTADMRDFLEQAYAALADYVDDDLVRVMAEYRDALAALTDIRPSDRPQAPAWQRVSETSRLAGEIARTIADEAAALHLEFRASV